MALRSPHPRPTRGKWCGMARQQAVAILPKGFNRISPFTKCPNRNSCSRVHIVTKHAPGWQWLGHGAPCPYTRRMELRWCSSRNRLSTPLIPRSWGRNTNPGDTPDPGRKNPAPLLRQAPDSRALLQVQNGSLGWWLGQETPGPPRSCITHCQRAEHDGMLVEHTVLGD